MTASAFSEKLQAIPERIDNIIMLWEIEESNRIRKEEEPNYYDLLYQHGGLWEQVHRI